jgi:hypothetical protein
MLTHLRSLLLTAGVAAISLVDSFAGGQIIQNDVFWKDTDGNPMYVQRGGTLKLGDTWYMYGALYGSATSYYNQWTGSNATTPSGSVACYSSKDLVNWKFEGAVFKYAGWFCGPNVAYNKNTKKYVLIAQGGNDVVFATSDKPTGPFTQTSVQTPTPMVNGGTGDATTFIDLDGRPYVVASNKSGRSNVYVIPVRESDYLTLEPTHRIYSGGGREGNCMFEYKGRYYAASSDLHGWNTSHTYYISSDKILGTYGKERIMTNTALDYSHVTQAGFFITVYGTVDTTVIYCGDRWSNNAGNGIGYNQWCPLTIKGDSVIFNSLSQWSIDAVTGTWKVGPGNNYILNPSFEADRISVSRVKGWEGTAPNSGSPHGAGKFCLSLGSGAKATQRIPENQSIADIPTGTYEMKAWVRSGGGTCQIAISGFGGSDMSKSSNAGSWTEISIPNIKISTGKATVTASNTGSGTCSLDDFSLISSDPVGVIQNYGRMNRGVTFDPATYRIHAEGWSGEAIRLEMFTVAGKSVLKQSVTGFDADQYSLPVGRFESGNYLLKVSTDRNSSVQKITLGR